MFFALAVGLAFLHVEAQTLAQSPSAGAGVVSASTPGEAPAAAPAVAAAAPALPPASISGISAQLAEDENLQQGVADYDDPFPALEEETLRFAHGLPALEEQSRRAWAENPSLEAIHGQAEVWRAQRQTLAGLRKRADEALHIRDNQSVTLEKIAAKWNAAQAYVEGRAPEKAAPPVEEGGPPKGPKPARSAGKTGATGSPQPAAGAGPPAAAPISAPAVAPAAVPVATPVTGAVILESMAGSGALNLGDISRDDPALLQMLPRIAELARATAAARVRVVGLRPKLITLQETLDEQERRITRMQEAGHEIRRAAMESLWRLSLPLWKEPLRFGVGGFFSGETRAEWSRQWGELGDYLRGSMVGFLLSLTALPALVGVFFWSRRRVRARVADEPGMRRAAVVFESPAAMAVAVWLLAFYALAPAPPHLLRVLIGAAALIPAIRILRRLLDPHLYPLLNVLVVFYFTDQVRGLASVSHLSARLLFLLEMAGAVAFLLWLRRGRHPGRQAAATPAPATHLPTEPGSVPWFLPGLLAAGAVAMSLAFALNILGAEKMGVLIGDTALQCAYIGMVLFAATRIADGMILGLLSVEPLSELSMVRRHRILLWQRAHRLVDFAAVALWLLGLVDFLSLRPLVAEGARALLYAGGQPTLFGQAACFGLVIWATFLLSRFIRFFMEEDLYPRTRMDRGLAYAVSTMVHYAVLLLGFCAAASLAGVEMTKFTILVSAFGVGMGFGLQNVVNNFVSGIILLFERPIKVGDVVQLDASTAGTVDHIGIRASIIRTGSGAEIILPNGKLIADQVVNWTLSNRRRNIEIPIDIAHGADPRRVIARLETIAAAHPDILREPAPVAQLVAIGPQFLQFKLIAWTNRHEAWGQIRSDLSVAVYDTLRDEGLANFPGLVGVVPLPVKT